MRPVAGLALGDRYRLTRQVAVGGMGEVWVADDSFLGRDVAVKVLREEYTGQEDFLKRLRTEARNSAALSHPNIAQMYDYGEQDGTGFLVMELVLGEPLADLLEREPVLPPKRLLPILAQTARGLHHAHKAGVVHRDVKPGNILLEHPGRSSATRSPVVKITDFGVSLAADQAPMTATGMVMGTAQYLSPEQAVGQLATPISDVYALGVVAYEATAGKRPFTGNTPVDIAVAHVNSPVPRLPTTVHPDLAALIYRLLEKDPARRPTSAGALADELDELARDIAADPLGARSRSARRQQAARAVAAPAVPAARAARQGPREVPSAAAVVADAAHDGAEATTQPARDDASASSAAPKQFPLRRDVHGARTAGRSPEAARAVDALRRDLARRHGDDAPRATRTRGAGRRPADPAAHRHPAPTKTPDAERRRTSTTTGLRLGRLGRVSWPLVGLAVLLVVLLVATVISNLAGGTSSQAAPSPTMPSSPTMPMAAAASSLPVSGMMLRNASRGRTAVTMTSKDI